MQFDHNHSLGRSDDLLVFLIRQDDVQNITYHGCNITASPTADSINGSTFILKCNFQWGGISYKLYITFIGSHFKQLLKMIYEPE